MVQPWFHSNNHAMENINREFYFRRVFVAHGTPSSTKPHFLFWREKADNPITLLGHWGTWGTVLGHLGHSSGALGALVWGTWGTRLGHLRKFFEVLEVPTMQLRHLFAITHLLGKAEALQ